MRKSPVFARKTAKNLGKRCVFRGFCRGQHFYPRNMVRTKGLAPLRRAPMNSPPGCSVCSRAFRFRSSFRKPLALARASPLKPLRSSISYQKRDGATAPSLFWCGRRDLNPHGLPQEPETCASANFATSAYSYFTLRERRDRGAIPDPRSTPPLRRRRLCRRSAKRFRCRSL